MTLKEKLDKLASEHSNPCVTISFNTHRTHPENKKDEIKLKNYLSEAQNRLLEKYDKTENAEIIEKLDEVKNEIDINSNLESLHIFLSKETKEIMRSTWNTYAEGVHISDSFALRPLIKNYVRSLNYLIMVLSQNGVQLYEADNDTIIHEIHNDDFPYPENPYYAIDNDRKSDSKYMDNLVREYLNNVDKAFVEVYNKENLKCVVICTEDNYSRLLQVANKPNAYIGYKPIDYNNTKEHQIAEQAYEIVREKQLKEKREAIEELNNAVSQGTIITDLQEIYRAAIDGQGELLVVSQDFNQPVIMQDERSFKIVDDASVKNGIDDITSNIAWEVLSKNGRVIFTSEEEIKKFGNMVMKKRY